MKTRFISLPAAIAVTFFVPVSSWALEGKVAVRSTLASGMDAGERFELRLDDHGGALPIEVGVTGFSAEVSLPRMETWSFGHWDTVDGKSTFVELGRVDPPAGKTLWLVFSANETAPDKVDSPDAAEDEASEPDEEAAQKGDPNTEAAGDDAGEEEDVLPWDVHAINVDAANLGEGGIVVLNHAQGTIEMELNDETVSLDVGGVKMVRPDPESGDRYNVKFYVIQNGRRRPFVTTNWFMGEKRRRLAAVVQGKSAPVPKVLVIDEITGGSAK